MSDEMQSNENQSKERKKMGLGTMLFKTLLCPDKKWKECESKFPKEKWKTHKIWMFPLRAFLFPIRFILVDILFEFLPIG